VEKIKVLFLCIHNSARSQMAEAYLNLLGKGLFEADKLAVDAMKEDGIDISKNKIDDVADFFKERRFYGYIITVCDASKAQKCPIFPGVPKRIHWNIEDPASFKGSYDEKLEKTKKVRDEIKEKVMKFIEEIN